MVRLNTEDVPLQGWVSGNKVCIEQAVQAPPLLLCPRTLVIITIGHHFKHGVTM